MQMKKISRIFIALALFLTTANINAQQNLRTAYFLDGYTFKYKMNPALAPERSFVSVPLLGNLGLGVESNLGLSTFLYPKGGELVTFLHPSVSNAEAMDAFKNRNSLNVNVNENIFALGFRTGKSFHTIDLSLRADAGIGLPKSFFSFVKEGCSNGTQAWNFNDVNLRLDTRLELAYGFSMNMDWLNVGARVKLLMGYARIDAAVRNMNVAMSEEKWSVKAAGDGFISGPVRIAEDSQTGMIDWLNCEMMSDTEDLLAPLTDKKNIGLAFDLGASVDFLQYFTASLAVNDLGYISWNNVTLAKMPSKAWEFNGLTSLKEDVSGVGDELSALGEDLAGLFNMEKSGEGLKRTVPLAATVHAAIEARMPFYERLSFGLLGTQRIGGAYSWTEGRLSANLAPVNFFSLSCSCAASNFGSSVGAVVNFHFPGINIYAGVDSFLPLMDVVPQYYIPVGHMNTNLALGLDITFGKAVGRYRKY